MQTLFNIVVVIQIIAALVMIGLVLIQHGKGADMGASFGSGSSGSLFGATGSANFLSRSTAVCAAIFFVCTLTLAYAATNRPAGGSGGSVIERAAAAASASAASAAASGGGAAASAASMASAPVAAPSAPVSPIPSK